MRHQSTGGYSVLWEWKVDDSTMYGAKGARESRVCVLPCRWQDVGHVRVHHDRGVSPWDPRVLHECALEASARDLPPEQGRTSTGVAETREADGACSISMCLCHTVTCCDWQVRAFAIPGTGSDVDQCSVALEVNAHYLSLSSRKQLYRLMVQWVIQAEATLSLEMRRLTPNTGETGRALPLM